MSAREELADIIQDVGEYIPGSHADDYVSPVKAADTILAAGYSKPRTITTAEDLDALPDFSAVLDADSDVSTKHNGMWHGYEMNPLESRKFAKCGPFTVLYTPKES